MSKAKARGDAVLKTLPDPLQAELYARYQKQSGPAVVAWLRETHGIKSNTASLSNFSHWFPFSRPLEMSAKFAEQFKAALKHDPNLKLNAEELSLAGQIAFEQQALQMQDLEGFVALRKVRLKEAEQSLNARRIVILEKQAALADKAASITGNQELSDEEKAAQMRALFGMG